MTESPAQASCLITAPEKRIYSTSILRAARHFRAARESTPVLSLIAAFQEEPETVVVAVLDMEDRVTGIVRRDHLFDLVGKPFGRDLLKRAPISEVAEHASVIDAQAELFGIAESVLHGVDDPGTLYFPLVDGSGHFLGILGSQDLANFLSRMTSEDIRLAGQLQDRLMAGKELTGGTGWFMEAWSRSAKGVGGDFYFSRLLPDGRAFLALCDVSGKGVAASLIVAMVWGMLQMYDFSSGLEELLVRINESVIASFHLEKYLTGIFMIYEASTRRLLVADMGHSHAFLFRGGKAYPLRGKQSNLPVGIEHEIKPLISVWNLKAGDLLVAYSDGITEQENPEGEEFGERRFASLVARASRAKERLQAFLPRAFDAWRDGTPQQDDMTFLAMAVEESEMPGRPSGGMYAEEKSFGPDCRDRDCGASLGPGAGQCRAG
ncbi:MAG: SpoIIE family protein phosphatase [Treponema sp.]|nr:SpoIIE family protein phosphatase [Treponema sp.]